VTLVTLTVEYPVAVSYPAGLQQDHYMVRLPLGRFCIESFYLTVRFRPSERYGKGAAERIIRRGFPLGSAPVTAVQFSHANGQPLLGGDAHLLR
jgi:hypothetical protein